MGRGRRFQDAAAASQHGGDLPAPQGGLDHRSLAVFPDEDGDVPGSDEAARGRGVGAREDGRLEESLHLFGQVRRHGGLGLIGDDLAVLYASEVGAHRGPHLQGRERGAGDCGQASTLMVRGRQYRHEPDPWVTEGGDAE